MYFSIPSVWFRSTSSLLEQRKINFTYAVVVEGTRAHQILLVLPFT
jgi:hypothetical protein